ncbi:unnamed protein product [Rotaria magnacalcarata]|uniref:Uncharacterized protein n=1 Tax=Rotaria magnacalcarata TaxID=392030 RepID=A0A8S2QWI3_9BILA|nr:unnamed protein product [Rotaria magnacalcarata]
MKYFQQHQILFHADFQLLLIRYGMIALENIMVLLSVSKLAKPNEIKSYSKTIFCLNLLIMNFAEEQNIEDYDKQDQRENVKQQMNTYSDIIQKEFKSSTMQDDIINNKGEKSTESFLLTNKSLQRKLISPVLPNIIEDLYAPLIESFQQMTDIEQISLKRNL